MYVRHLSVADFRSYPRAELALGPGVTTLVGFNGQGKTNLVEAVGYVATLSSHRVATDAPLVRYGAAQAVVRAAIVRDERESLVELEIVPGRANRARLNRSPVTRPRDVLGTLRTVLFAPEDLALVKGDPSERRRFLDDLLVQRQPRWAGVRSDYDRVLKQRNALLKSGQRELRAALPRGGRRTPSTGYPQALSTDSSTPPVEESGASPVDGSASGAASPTSVAGGSAGEAAGGYAPSGSSHGARSEVASALSTLVVWDEQLATLGAQLTYARLRLLRDLTPFLADAYDAVSDSRSSARALYRSSLYDEAAAAIGAGEVPELERLRAAMLASFELRRTEEIERGLTLIGPHRDDLQLHLGELPAKGYASHGESWSFALALKLAAYQLLRRDLGTDPVLILDDVFAELDARRRRRLAGLVADGEQVLITAAVEEDVPEALAGRRFHVTAGQVQPEESAEPAGGSRGSVRPGDDGIDVGSGRVHPPVDGAGGAGAEVEPDVTDVADTREDQG